MPFLTPNDGTLDNLVCRCIRFPDDDLWIAILSGLFHDLCQTYNYEQFGTATPEQCRDIGYEIFQSFSEGDCMIGLIMPYATATPPTNALACDGSIFLRESYPKLYERINPALVIDADSAYLPDLRDRFALGAGLTYATLSSGGAATVALTAAQNGSHSHTTQPHSHTNAPHSHTEITAIVSAAMEPVPVPVPSAIPGAGLTGPASVAIDPATVTVDNSGNGEAHENMPPYTALPYCIIAR